MASAAAAPIRRRRRRLRAVAAPVLLLLALAAGAVGCGGGDEALPDDIEGVCREVADRFAEAQELPPSSWESAQERTEALYEISSSGDEALRGLESQAPDAETYERYLAERAKVTAQLRRALGALDDRDARIYDSARAES